ncbi:MAG: DUF4082 domain-containing protein [Chitinophagaceae bacterium]
MIRSITFCINRRLFFIVFYVFVSTAFSFAQNAIVTENANAGNPNSEWGVPDFRDNRIAGYATKMSLNRGQTVRFKINVQSGATYTIKIYRIGYYGGNGARLKQDLGTFSGTVQPNGITNSTTGMLDCSNWSESASWAIPSNAVSGLYIAKLERTGGGSNHIVFIVRNDASTSDMYFQFPDATWQAYNGYGGTSNYDGTTSWPSGHAVKVSYNRPFFPYNSLFNTDGREADWYMNSEYPMIRWLEMNGYDVTYTSCNDVDNNGGRLLNHKVFISNGHDEYWSKDQRANVESARNAGVNLAFFSGNEVYWKTRWESNDGTEDRTLVCYKEGTMADGTINERACGSKCDASTSEWTGLWRMGANYDGGKPENALTGQISWVEYPSQIEVPAFYKKLRFWRNSSVANLSAGQTATLGVNTLGYEWDYEQPAFASSYPAGRMTMSSKTVNSLIHKLSLYRHSSGALVFGAGTVQWSWGLDGNHWGGTTTVSTEMQQATVNLFADMGVQPATLQSGLSGATKSTDASLPVASITSPSNGSSFAVGASVNFSGTAIDAGGGVVAAVEISTDGGSTWSQATVNNIDGNITWNYTWTAGGNGNYLIVCRGVDDSGNIGNGSSITVIVGTGGGDTTPPTVSSVSPSSGATGVSTSTNVIANFSEAVNSSTVTSSTFQLRDAGSNLVSATVSASSNQITLTPSATLTASTTYTVTIVGGASGVKDLAGNALVNNYSWTFTTAGSGGGGGTTYTVFQTTNTPSVSLANDGQGIELGMRFRSTQDGFVTGVRYYKGAGASGTHIGSLWNNAGTTRLAQITFTNETSSGWQQMLFSNPVAITAGVTYVVSYYSTSGDYAATKPYFTAAVVNGPLIGLADGTDGANGLYRYTATSAFPNSSFQSSNYWADVVFSTSSGSDVTPPAVSSVSPTSGATGININTAITANFSEAVTASSVTGATFQLRDAGSNLVTAVVSTSSNQITLTPSAVLANSTVYTVTIVGGASGVKDLAGNALVNNFTWSFTTGAAADNTPPTVSSVSPVNGATGIGVNTTAVANLSEAINASTVTSSTFQLRDAGSNLVAATVNASSNQITLTPTAALTASATYTVTIVGGASGVKDLAGNALTNNYSWSFTTAAAGGGGGTNFTVFQTTDVPSVPLANDEIGIELGMRFRSTQDGFVTGVRYYKGAGATGAHIGSLWNNAGTTRLAQVTFTNETASGWQQMLFSSPVAITAGVTYVVSYYSPSGDYAATKPYFTAAVVNGPLTGLADGTDGLNGVYNYSATSVFPTSSFMSSNYWVDVVFTTGGTAAPTVTTHPASQAVCAGSNVSFTSAATGGTPAVQWQSSTNGTTWTNITGATSATLTFAAVTADNGKQYRAAWTNSGGTVNSITATLTVNAIPAAPSVSVVNSCGSSTLTAGSFTGSLLWSNGSTATSITVATSGTYTVTQTVNGCTSLAGSGTAAPISSNVTAPTVSVVNNCSSSTLTAGSFTGSLLWSNGATTSSITVTTPGTYTVTQTVNGCTSPAANGVAAPKPIPTLSSNLAATATSGTAFAYTPASAVTGTTFTWTRAAVTGISNAAGSGTGNISETLVNTTSAAVNVTYVYTLTANGCTNTQNVVVTVNTASTVNCVINSSITQSFNSTAIPAGRYIWFNSSFNPGSLGSGTATVTITVTNTKVTFTASGVQYILNVPDARIRLDATVLSATTQFINNVWETAVPRSFTNYIFMNGLSYTVPVNFPGSITNVVWTASVSINKTGVSLARRWSAAVYTSFAANAGVNVKPITSALQNPYLNADAAGTPENFKSFVVSGAKGNGGTNYTGTFTTTQTSTCAVPPTGTRGINSPLTSADVSTIQAPDFSDLLSELSPDGKLSVQVLPNPSSNYFNMLIKGNPESPVTVRVMDMFGRVVEKYEKIASTTVLKLGYKLRSGSYFAEVIQGGERKVVKIIKAR